MEDKNAIERMESWCLDTLRDMMRLGFEDAAGVYEECLNKARALAAEEKAQDKKCRYYGDGIQSDDQCPGAVNTRNCPGNTDEDCNISMRPPASLVEEWALSKIGGAQVGYEKEIAAVCGNELKTILSRYAPQESIPDRVEELKKCLLGLSEQKLIEDNALVECLEILSRFTPQESLADLASRKDFDRIRITNFRGGWHMRFMNYFDETDHKIGPYATYAEAEAKAREFLEKLPDAKTP